jgi:hypothetical protein
MNTALVLAMGHSHRKAIRAAGRQAAAENDLLYPPTQYGLALQLARLPLVVCLLCIFTLNLPRVSAVTQFLQVLVQAISNGAFSQLLLYYIGGTKQLLTLTAASTFDVWGPPGPCCCCRVPYACGCCAAESLRPSHLKVPPPPPPSASAPPATARHRPECAAQGQALFYSHARSARWRAPQRVDLLVWQYQALGPLLVVMKLIQRSWILDAALVRGRGNPTRRRERERVGYSGPHEPKRTHADHERPRVHLRAVRADGAGGGAPPPS